MDCNISGEGMAAGHFPAAAIRILIQFHFIHKASSHAGHTHVMMPCLDFFNAIQVWFSEQ